MTEGAAYTRYSTDRQCSTAVQLERIGQYAEQNSIHISPDHIYSDEGISGTHTNTRRGFLDLMEAARRGEFDCVVIYDLTRGSRDVVDWFQFRKDMRRLGIRVHSVMERLGDLDNPSDFLTELITVGMGQTHVLTSRRKSMDKMDMLAREGAFLGGVAPLGLDVKDGQWSIIPKEAAAVVKAFQMYADGYSYKDILSQWPPDVIGKRGEKISKNSLHYMFKNEKYIGVYIWGGRKVKYFGEWAGGGPSERMVRIEGIIPRIIDDETWGRVKKRMGENKHNKTNKGKREYLLSGLIRCGQCGHAYVGVTTTNKKGYEYKFYTCVGKRQKRICESKNLPANGIETLVVGLLMQSVLDGSMIEAAADAIMAAGKNQDAGGDLAALRRELADKQKRLNNLVEAVSGGLNSSAVAEKISSLEVEIRVLEAKIKSMRPGGELSREYLVAEMRKDAERLKNDPKAIKVLIRKYITSIEVTDDAVVIHSVADLAMGAPLPEGTKKYITDENVSDVNTVGCGGAKAAVFMLWIPRLQLYGWSSAPTASKISAI